MEIKRTASPHVLIRFLRNLLHSKILLTLLIYNFILLLLIVGLFQMRPAYQKVALDKGGRLLKGLWSIPINRVKSLFHGLSTQSINLDIKHVDFQRLAYKREKTLQDSMYRHVYVPRLNKTSEDWVPGQIRTEDETLKVRVRLKGRLGDHWANREMWSLNVKVRGDNTFHGMKRFSLQHPKVRSFLNEWILHQLFKQQGLIHLRYDFINVSLNGKAHQLYALEEGLGKRLIENNERREGPIVKINTDPSWFWGQLKLVDAHFGNMSIDVYQKTRMKENKSQLNLFNKAKNLLNRFRQGKISSSKTFDKKQMAKFLASLDLIGGHHSLDYDNIRLYYNPVTSLLEPIGFDNQDIKLLDVEGLSGFSIPIKTGIPGPPHKNTTWEQLILQDKDIFELYMKELEKISRKEFLTDFLSSIEKELLEKRILLQSRYWNFNPPISWIKDTLHENQKYIRDILTVDRTLVHAYLDNFESSSFDLILRNNFRLPIEVTSVEIQNEDRFPITHVLIQPESNPFKPVFTRITIPLPEEKTFFPKTASQLKVHFRFPGGTKSFNNPVHPWTYFDANLIAEDSVRASPNTDEFKFLSEDKKKKTITFKSGNWTLNKNLILPENYLIVAESPLHLDLKNKASLTSFSPLQFLGTADDPIGITSSDGTGQGLLVIQASDKSQLKHVNFSNLTNLKNKSLNITGAITFYESPVEINRCTFSNNNSEDALNIIRTSFSINNSRFENSPSDAFDGDFIEGTISQSSFEHCGNDCIDVSGSQLVIEENFINKAGDKGLSVGERSQVIAKSITVQEADIAFVSKDDSDLSIDNSLVSGSTIAFSAYQKKSEFGPARIIAHNITLNNVATPHLIEIKSVLRLDGEVVQTEEGKIKEKMYGNEYGRKTPTN